MCSDHKGWPARLVATLTALALIVAGTYATWAHAAVHLRHAAPQAVQGAHDHGPCAHQPTGHDHAAHGHIGHVLAGDAEPDCPGHEGGDTDGCAVGHCGPLCHFGQAILASATDMPPAALAAPLTQAVVASHGQPPGGLDRPPKPSVRA